MTVAELEQTELISRTMDIPYWYSYPPKNLFLNDSDCEPLANQLRRLSGAANLYVHVPFCSMRCSFCSLLSVRPNSDEQLDGYISRLHNEAEMVAALLPANGPKIDLLYIGGGTPTLLSRDHVGRLMDAIRGVFDCAAISQASVEFSPDTVTAETIESWRVEGFARASIGVQSFNEQILNAMNRIHGRVEMSAAVSLLLNNGFEDVNIDLIYGNPGQTLNQWREDLVAALDTGATSITTYPLALRANTGYGISAKKGVEFPRQTTLRTMHQFTCSYLRERGWQSTSAVTFSRDAHFNRLERAEAMGIPTIGLGAGARSYFEQLHTCSEQYFQRKSFGVSLDSYLKAVDSARLPVFSQVGLTSEEAFRRRLILGLMTGGASMVQNNAAWWLDIERDIGSLVSEGFVVKSGAHVKLSDLGHLNAGEVGLRLASSSVKAALRRSS